jgi:uncharacterized protein YcbX
VSAARISGLAITPVKGTRLRGVDRVELTEHGVRENRRFFLIDSDARMVNATHLGALNTIISDYSDAERRLSIEFPDGRELKGPVELGDPVSAGFYSRRASGHAVLGDWSDAISDYVGKPLRLVEAGAEGAVDRGPAGAVTLISEASLARLAEQAGRDEVDVRRFRMLIEIEGVEEHAEDGWIGRTVNLGEAAVRPEGHVGRCVITTRHPDTGEIDLQTLKILGSYRRDAVTTEPVAFGVYGAVVRPGTLRVGDPVTLDG